MSRTSRKHVVHVCTYSLSLGVMGEMGNTIVGVLTPFLLDKAPPKKMVKLNSSLRSMKINDKNDNIVCWDAKVNMT